MQDHAAERTKDDTSLWLLHITDNHLFTDPSEGRHGINSVETFQRVLASATKSRQPDLVVDTGDIAHDHKVEVYETFVSMVSDVVDCPMIATPGNHDLAALFDQVLSRETVTMKNWQIVAVDTHVEGSVSGFVGQAEMHRLEVELGTSEVPTLVIGHHPGSNVGCSWIDEHRIENGDEFLRVLGRYPHVRGFLSGHVHQAFDGDANGLKLMTTPSTCWQFKPRSDSFAIDELSAGWRWLELRPDGVINSRVDRLVESR